MRSGFRKSLDFFAKYFYLISLCLLFCVYGVFAGQYQWFPAPQLFQAKSAFDALVAIAGADDNLHTVEQTMVIDHAKRPAEGFILVSGGKDALREYCPERGALAWLMDRDGKVQHTWEYPPDLWESLDGFDTVPGYSEVYPVDLHLLPDGGLLVSFHGLLTWPYTVGMARLDRDSKVVWKKVCHAHHWFDVNDQQQILTPTMKEVSTPYPIGNTRGKIEGKNEQVWDDQVSVLSFDGEILEEHSMLQLLDRSGVVGLFQGAAEPTENLDTQSTDPLHLNSIQRVGQEVAAIYDWLNPDDLLISFRSINTIGILDWNTKELKWMLAGKTLRQHSPIFDKNGDVLVFDNAGGRADQGGTRIARVNLATREVETLFPPEGLDIDFYSEQAGHLALSRDKSSVLVTMTWQSKVYEIDLSTREILWEYRILDENPRKIYTAKYCYDVEFEMNQVNQNP